MTKDLRFTKSANTVRHSIQTQIPSFYNDEGIGFVRFAEAYYQHLEANTLNTARNLQNIGDVDTTPDKYLINFNNKFTFGASRTIRTLPSVITGDLRFIIKHIKDIYRSKGTLRGTRLFFRVAFNDAPEIFVPGEHLFRPSASDYRRPDVIEVSADFVSDATINSFAGQRIVGSKTGATAVVASVFRKKVGPKKFTYIVLDNITGTFFSGDKITVEGSDRVATSVAPEVVGPVREVEIIAGSVRIPEGTTFTAKPLPDGVELKVSATDFERLLGTFDPNPVQGTLYSTSSTVTVTRAPLEIDSVERGSYAVTITNPQFTDQLDGELIQSYAESIANTTFYGVAASANTIGNLLQYDTRTYGDIAKLVPTTLPSGYTKKPFVRVEDVVFTKTFPLANVSLSNTAVTGANTTFDTWLLPMTTPTGNVDVQFGNTTILGHGTTFTTDFEVNDVIKVADTTNRASFFNISGITNNTIMTIQEKPITTMSGAEYSRSHTNYIKLIDSAGNETVRVVNTHINNTSLFIDDKVLADELSESSGLSFQIGYPTGDVNFAEATEPLKYNLGEDASYTVEIISDAGSVKGVQILNAGFGYNPENEVTMVSEDMTPLVNFNGGGGSGAAGFVNIAADNTIDSITITNPGSGYTEAPKIFFEGGTGSGAAATSTIAGGAVVSTTITNAGNNYVSKASIIVKPIKSGQSVFEGRTVKKRSEPSEFLRIQDSNFWQEYSYEIGSGIDSSKYEEVVLDLMHMAGRKLFTKGLIKDNIKQSSSQVASETVTASGV